MRRSTAFAIVTGIAILVASVTGAPRESLQAPIKKVTVYPDQAQVTRIGSLNLTAGNHIVLFEDLPGGALDASFQVSGSGIPGITLYGISYATEEHLESPSPKIAGLTHELDSLIRNHKDVVVDRIEALKKLREFLTSLTRGPLSDEDESIDKVAKEGINVALWATAYNFLSEKTTLISDSMRRSEQELANIDSRIRLKGDELRKLTTVNQRRTKTVSVELNLEQAGEVTMSLEYLVPGATWSPMYDARILDNPDVVNFTYSAEVSQKTGEDWPGVELQLSTVQPSLGTGPGELAPWNMGDASYGVSRHYGGSTGQIRGRLTSAVTGEPIIGASILIVGTTQGAMTDHQGNFQILRVDPGIYTLRISSVEYTTVEVTNVGVSIGATTEICQRMDDKGATDLNKTITVEGTQDIRDKFVVDSRVTIGQESIKQRPVQTIDNLLAQVGRVRTTSDGEVYAPGGRANEVSVVMTSTVVGVGAYPVLFQVSGTETIASGGDAARVTVANWNLDGATKLISRPRNRQGAFRIIKLQNQDRAPLMPGRVAIFVGAHFLGHTQVEQLIAPNEEFELPFGVDNRVMVKREVAGFTRETKDDDIQTSQTIQITLSNLDSISRTVELEEALPVSNDSRVRVKLGKIVPLPSPESAANMPRWILTLAPGEIVKIAIPYEVRYPAGLRVAGL